MNETIAKDINKIPKFNYQPGFYPMREKSILDLHMWFRKEGEWIKEVTGNQVLILVILSLAIFLRIYNLADDSIWGDEIYSLRYAKYGLFQLFDVVSSRDTNPPLYYAIMHYWISSFGETEFSLRFLSALFGVSSVLMMYKVGTVLFDKNVGLLSSFILALSPFHIYFSQLARGYTLTAFLSLVSFYFFLKLFKKQSFSISIAYILSSSLLMYNHFYGLLVLGAQNIYVLTNLLTFPESKFDYKRWVLLQVILAILYMPWIAFCVRAISAIQSGFWIGEPTIGRMFETFVEYSGSTALALLYLVLSLFSILIHQRVVKIENLKHFFILAPSYGYEMRNSGLNSMYLLLVWMLTIIILPFMISIFSAPIYVPRYTIAASLAFYLIVARGIIDINNKYIRSSVIIIIIVLSSIRTSDYYNSDKEQWREVAKYVDINSNPGDLLVFNGGGNPQLFIFDYYSTRTDLIKKHFPESGRLTVDRGNIKELQETIQSNKRVWVILCRSEDHEGLIKKTLNESYDLIYNKEYEGIKAIDLSLFEKFE